jgi:hypothetical protein
MGLVVAQKQRPSVPLQGQQHRLVVVTDESTLLPFADVLLLCGERREGPEGDIHAGWVVTIQLTLNQSGSLTSRQVGHVGG